MVMMSPFIKKNEKDIDMYKYQIEDKDTVKTLTIALNKEEYGGSDAMKFSEIIKEGINGEAKLVIVDFKETDMMNSSGIGMLVGTLSNLKNNNIPLQLHNINERIMPILKSTKLDRVFDIK